jgi:hypothetical protein
MNNSLSNQRGMNMGSTQDEGRKGEWEAVDRRLGAVL